MTTTKINNFSILSDEVNLCIEFDKLLRWLNSKDNFFSIFKKSPNAQNNFSELMLLIFLLQDKHYSFKASNFYLIYVKDKKTLIQLIHFNKNAAFSDFLYILSNIHKIIDSHLNNFDQIFIYFPFLVGDIYSKKKYLYEINAKHMDTLVSSQSTDVDRRSCLSQYKINQDHAILNEFYDNESINYKSNFAYIDYIEIYLKKKDLATWYFNLSDEAKYFSILNTLDNFYFDMVTEQQNKVHDVILYQLDIPEFKTSGTKFSFSDLVQQFIKSISKANKLNYQIDKDNLLPYLVKNKKKEKHLYTLQKLYKQNNLTGNEQVLFNEVAINFPFWTDEDYAIQLQNILNSYDKDNSIETTNLVKLFFSRDSSIWYEEKDNRRYFIKDIKKIFSNYEKERYRVTKLQYLFQYRWVSQMKKALLHLLK